MTKRAVINSAMYEMMRMQMCMCDFVLLSDRNLCKKKRCMT